MAHRSQCSSVGDNPLDPNYLPPHYREEYRLAIDALVEKDLDGYYNFLQNANVVDFLSRPEIDHIKNTIQVPQSVSSVPELTYYETDQDGSSDTYWPLHSDLDAPGLDLGWPMQQHSFVGPTEVTTLVNPADPEMPSIKEQARRLIKSAQQVVAVVMDMFTDVDIFSDLLEAAQRHVPVYILLDEHNSHHFVSMVSSCKVNLDLIHMMRVRTVAGITYFCRTGKSFKGQVMDRFLLVDCRAVLSGNYSFMWSFEKIHRCIAHMFLGELVATFDEEFRILFAQSQPLVIENSLVPMPPDNSSSFLGNQFGIKRSQSLRSNRGLFRPSELLGYPFGGGGDRLDTGLPFRRDDPFRQSLETGGLQIGKYTSHQMRMQQTFLEQGRPMIASRQLEMNTYKRHSYAEGTRESYSSSRQYMKSRVMNNLDEMEAQYQRDQQFYQSDNLAPESGRYDSHRNSGFYQLDQYSDPMYQLELEAPETHNVLSSEDLGHDPDSRFHQGAAHFGQPNQKRPTLTHAYACQSSPTQPHPPDNKQMFPSGEQARQPQDPSVKQGLRSWRINSYLSTYENSGEEGLQQPLGPDTFDEPQPQPDSTSRQYIPEGPGLRINTQEPPAIPIKPKFDIRPRFGKPILPDKKQVKDIISDQASLGMDSQKKSDTDITLTTAETDSEKEKELKDAKNLKDISITKHESFRSRLNPMLQRSSRLRSSLIFSSSKLEQHSSAISGEKLQEDDENNSIRTSSIVAEILEKRRSFSREPFDWSKHKKMDEKDDKGLIQEEGSSKTEEDSDKNTKEIKEESKSTALEEKDTTKQTQPSLAKEKKPPVDMNDPVSRLQFFKELSMKRKNAKKEEALNNSQEPLSKKADISDNQPSTVAATIPSVSVTPAETFSTTLTTTTATTTATTTVQIDSAAKPSVVTTNLRPSEDKLDKDSSVRMEESTDAAKKEAKEAKIPKPFPSPKFSLKPFKSSHTRHTSCGEDILTDATDAEKSELKKSRSLSSSGMSQTESKEISNLSRQGSNLSLNVVGSEGKDTKALDFLKKQTQRLKGLLGPKGEKKNAGGSGTAEEKQMKPVPEISEDSSTKVKETPDSTTASDNSKSSNKPSPTRYQSSTSNVLYSSNLRDDTKVILEQISANSQKNRQELAKQADESENAEGDKAGHVLNLDREPFQRFQTKNRFNRAQVNPQERDSLLKRIESMRKEKKVYSRFEMGNNLG